MGIKTVDCSQNLVTQVRRILEKYEAGLIFENKDKDHGSEASKYRVKQVLEDAPKYTVMEAESVDDGHETRLVILSKIEIRAGDVVSVERQFCRCLGNESVVIASKARTALEN